MERLQVSEAGPAAPGREEQGRGQDQQRAENQGQTVRVAPPGEGQHPEGQEDDAGPEAEGQALQGPELPRLGQGGRQQGIAQKDHQTPGLPGSAAD